ncbi:MBL fold metallo-hydrolase [Aquirufa antheringensis]|uniref:MBL fold metallo-hydrolase n=1 Tax=Aquirufa antheringensis TaxID=2516559 RepID=UPI0010329C5B|nr:MBL fold metallo-hydrolase [Aquirufa antheringensis]TBH71743.1 MBL fold metallo-hydrolase [Aquirufa antheringensis]
MVEQLFCNINNKSSVYRYKSELFGACTYFILEKEILYIVDPGYFNNHVFDWVYKHNNRKIIVFITHEHFDHHFHANEILLMDNAISYSPSKEFQTAVKDLRINLSYYYGYNVETILKDGIESFKFHVIKTPGHSKESYCYWYDGILFGGDTVIEKKNLVLKLPGSNKIEFMNSYNLLNSTIDNNTIVLPGHGDLFYFNEWEL